MTSVKVADKEVEEEKYRILVKMQRELVHQRRRVSSMASDKNQRVATLYSQLYKIKNSSGRNKKKEINNKKNKNQNHNFQDNKTTIITWKKRKRSLTV